MQPHVAGQFSDIDRTSLACQVPEDRVSCRIAQRAGLELLRARSIACNTSAMEVIEVSIHRSTSCSLGA